MNQAWFGLNRRMIDFPLFFANQSRVMMYHCCSILDLYDSLRVHDAISLRWGSVKRSTHVYPRLPLIFIRTHILEPLHVPSCLIVTT